PNYHTIRCGVNASFIRTSCSFPHFCSRLCPLLLGFRGRRRPSAASLLFVRGVFASLQRAADCPALTRSTDNDTRFEMQDRDTRSTSYGPWLVGLGAALWGTESAWRI